MSAHHTRRHPRPGDASATRFLEDVPLDFAPASYDETTGSVEVCWSTGADVRRYDWCEEVYYIERLDLAGANMERLQAGAPLLLDHWRDSMNVVGSVEPGSVRIENGRGLCTLRFDRSSELGQQAEAKVKGGHLRFVSIGYSVQTWERQGAPAGGEVVHIARAWQPFEISLVPVPADAGAGTRAAPEAPGDSTTTTRATAAHEGKEAAVADKSNDTTTVDQEAARNAAAEATRAERARAKALTDRVRELGLDHTVAVELIEAGTTLEGANARFVDELARRNNGDAKPPAGARAQVGNSHEDPANIRAAMADAIVARTMPGVKLTGDRHREFMAFRPSDMLMHLAQARGERVHPGQRLELIERAFHSNSDFPLLLAAAANKMLEAGYQAAAPAYRRIAARRNFNDFKPHRFITVGDFPAPQQMREGGSITMGTISEKQETVSAITYARGVTITRQALINDDLGAFNEWTPMIGRRVADFENATAFSQVNLANGDGPTLVEGNAAVFGTAAGRANKAGTGGAISEASLDAAYAAMMAQTSLDGIRLNIQPRILLTGAAQRGAALRFTRDSGRVIPEASANVPLYSDLEPVADANVPGNRWYTFADPEQAPVYIYGYVAGQDGPQIRVFNQVQGRDGIVLEVLHDWAFGAVDYRGGYFNAGA
jgi:phage head maturation protease